MRKFCIILVLMAFVVNPCFAQNLYKVEDKEQGQIYDDYLNEYKKLEKYQTDKLGEIDQIKDETARKAARKELFTEINQKRNTLREDLNTKLNRNSSQKLTPIQQKIKKSNDSKIKEYKPKKSKKPSYKKKSKKKTKVNIRKSKKPASKKRRRSKGSGY